jgi:hypothetical protein
LTVATIKLNEGVTMKSALCVLLLSAGLFAAGPAVSATLAYPSADNASFLVDHPDDWTAEPGAEVGDYLSLFGPTGVVVQLRTIEGDEESAKQAALDSIEYIKDTYKSVKMQEPTTLEHRGLTVMQLAGSGVNDEGNPVGFLTYLVALDDGHIAEIWYVVDLADEEGQQAAIKVLDSFRTP